MVSEFDYSIFATSNVRSVLAGAGSCGQVGAPPPGGVISGEAGQVGKVGFELPEGGRKGAARHIVKVNSSTLRSSSCQPFTRVPAVCPLLLPASRANPPSQGGVLLPPTHAGLERVTFRGREKTLTPGDHFGVPPGATGPFQNTTREEGADCPDAQSSQAVSKSQKREEMTSVFVARSSQALDKWSAGGSESVPKNPTIKLVHLIQRIT